MNIKELYKYRNNLLEDSIDDDGFISQVSVLEKILPYLVDTKLIESEEINITPPNSTFSIIGYWENESGERLQIFVFDSNSVSISIEEDQIIHTRKDHHVSLLKQGIDFIKKSFKRHLNDSIQDSDPLSVLYHKLGSSNYIDQIDVIEIILLSTSISAESRGVELTPKRFSFDDVSLNVSYTKNRDSLKKEILIQNKLIDIGYIYQVLVSKGNADPLLVEFKDTFGCNIEVLKAAEEDHFESYLGVIPAYGLAKLYRKESSRLLEKNVRSFLNFKVEANQEMRNTIRKDPEKFIAYNNGLTITGSSGEIIKEDGKLFIKSLTDFQIVNGGQTTAGIYFSSKDGLDISKINLMAKINIAKDVSETELNELISNISRFSNTQSKVSKVDLKTSNNELKIIKTLSRSVFAPNQNKWYFDLAKGEFNTLVRLRGSKKELEKEFPNKRRFTKEQLGKYYTAWGLKPYLVKLGGVKVFRYFIEDISGDGDKRKPQQIDREFYEKLIAKIILFRELETLHGSGKNSIGQLRSAVIPYTMSAVFLFMNNDRNKPDFNLELIWKNQELDNFMRSFFMDLMILMNQLIKNYSQSDDYGTYSKKEQLWKDISKSKELHHFFNQENALRFVNKYGLAKTKSRNKSKDCEINFTIISKTVEIASNGIQYYKDLIKNFNQYLSENEENKIRRILHLVKTRKNIDENDLLIIDSFVDQIYTSKPNIFEEIDHEIDHKILNSLECIINQFNNAKNNNLSIQGEFHKNYQLATSKNIKYSSVFNTIGNKLSNCEPPSLSEVFLASEFYSKIKFSSLL